MIYAPKSAIHLGRTGNAVNTKIDFRGYEISIAMDDSCATRENLSRTSICIYKGDKNVTQEIAGCDEIYGAASQQLFEVMQKIDAIFQAK